MIMRLSGKMGKKIGVSGSPWLAADANPFADWSAHLFRADRTEYIIITNSVSLYSMVMFGRGITTDSIFLDRATSHMSEFIRDDGHESIYERFVAPATALIRFSRALHPAVTGSMNDLVVQAKFHLIEEEMSPFDASLRVNECPMSYLNFSTPREAFGSLWGREAGPSEKAEGGDGTGPRWADAPGGDRGEQGQ